MGSDQKRSLLAVVLSGLVLVGWQMFFAPKQEVAQQSAQTLKTGQSNVPSKPSTINTPNSPEQVSEVKKPESEVKVDKKYTLTSNETALEFGSDLKFYNFSNPNSVFPFELVSGSSQPIKISVFTGTNWVTPNFEEQNNNGSLFTAVDSNLGITLTASVTEKKLVNINLNSANPYRYRFSFESEPGELDNKSQREFVLLSTSDVERHTVGDEVFGESSLKWFGIDFDFHLIAVSLATPQKTKYSTSTVAGPNGNKNIFNAELIGATNVFNFDLVFTKKSYDGLTSMGNNLHLAVDFGILGLLAVPILRGLQFFYEFIPNYGVSIILLTLLIRLVTFPLQYKSMKSMKKMQTLQPELEKIKAKFADDKERIQKETMELFKRSGANPLGGCLPMLLQMPIFFAFYKVLFGSVELVGAPFFGWISDLSIKDPFYVLPLLMAASMLVQQKLTPTTTADPTQKKVMMFMPVVFGLIMKDLPSGLVLYIFVSTLFGLGQQLFINYKTE